MDEPFELHSLDPADFEALQDALLYPSDEDERDSAAPQVRGTNYTEIHNSVGLEERRQGSVPGSVSTDGYFSSSHTSSNGSPDAAARKNASTDGISLFGSLSMPHANTGSKPFEPSFDREPPLPQEAQQQLPPYPNPGLPMPPQMPNNTSSNCSPNAVGRNNTFTDYTSSFGSVATPHADTRSRLFATNFGTTPQQSREAQPPPPYPTIYQNPGMEMPSPMQNNAPSSGSPDSVARLSPLDPTTLMMVDIEKGPFKVGSDIPGDGNNIILAARTSDHPYLPIGNHYYEEKIDVLIGEENITKVKAFHVHKVLQRMGVTKNKDGSFTSTPITFWQIVNGKPGKDWREKSFLPSMQYQALVDKTKRTMETRLRKTTSGVTGNGDSDVSSRLAASPPESKRKRTDPEVGGIAATHYQVPMNDEFKSSLNKVRSCETIEVFIEMYEAGIVYDSLDRIRRDLRECGKNVETWAEDWAKSLYQGDEYAKALGQDRKLSLELLYTLCNCWKGEKGPQTLTAENVVNDFGDKRIMGILGLCLPMDRAHALYNMMIPGESQPGMHWVSEIHVARDAEWAERMEDYDGFPTMNKRLIWLMEDEALAELNLGGSKFMRKYTAPLEAHGGASVV